VKKTEKVALFTDSAYAHGVLLKGWKAKANQELIAEIKEDLERWPNLEIYWIAGHVGTEGNERADELANEGVDGISAIYQE
jgi:ribonuclease HI